MARVTAALLAAVPADVREEDVLKRGRRLSFSILSLALDASDRRFELCLTVTVWAVARPTARKIKVDRRRNLLMAALHSN